MFDAGKLRSVESLDAAGRSLRAAEVGRVVGCNWTVDEGRWRRSSRGDTARCLMRVS